MSTDGAASGPDPSHRILVVDDTEMNRDLLVRRLNKRGYEVIEAHRGDEALGKLAVESVDLILLDWMMPGMSGLEVLQLIREDERFADLPVIMATAKSDNDDIVEALEMGADDYVTKPINYPVLYARMDAILARRRRTRTATDPSPRASVQSPTEIVPGTILAGRYEVEAQIGEGSFGSVFRARHQELERDVAIKVLSSGDRAWAVSHARVRQEGVAACRVKHPNAVSIIDFVGGTGGLSFLVMELLQGHTLYDELKNGSISPGRTAEIGLAICFALEEAHRCGIIHRDVKPANIFIEKAGRTEVPKVLDFGVAKIMDEGAKNATATHDGRLVGTPAYMAPERFTGDAYGPSSDIYSLGIVLYEAIAGRRPFVAAGNDAVSVGIMHVSRQPDPVLRTVADVSPELESLIMACLNKKPEERPSIEELAQGLADSLGKEFPDHKSSKVELSSPPRIERDVTRSGVVMTQDTQTIAEAPDDPRTQAIEGKSSS